MKIVASRTYPQIDRDKARTIGAQLKEKRQTSGQHLDYVADKVLLSKQQLLGIEAGEDNLFYGAKLYAQAADKYAAYLELNIVPSDHLFGDTESNNPTEIPTPTASSLNSRRTTAKLKIVLAVLVLAVLTGLLIFEQQPVLVTLASTVPPPTAAKAEPDKSDTATPPAPAPAADEYALSTGKIRLTFNGSSWVQTVNKNSQKLERTYHKGESLVIEPGKLQALIIGNANVVSVSSHTGEIFLTPYRSNGSQVARLIGPQIRELAQKSNMP